MGPPPPTRRGEISWRVGGCLCLFFCRKPRFTHFLPSTIEPGPPLGSGALPQLLHPSTTKPFLLPPPRNSWPKILIMALKAVTRIKCEVVEVISKVQSCSPSLGSPTALSLVPTGTINNLKYAVTGPRFSGGSRKSKCHPLPSPGATQVTMGLFLSHLVTCSDISQRGFGGFVN